MATVAAILPELMGDVDRRRRETSQALDPSRRADLGQYFTPAPTARFMASMVTGHREHLRVLDPGAGVGSLTAAWIAEMITRPNRPRSVMLMAYEIDAEVLPALQATLAACEQVCIAAGVACRWTIHQTDFIADGVRLLDADLWSPASPSAFDLVLLNPPYRKFRTDSAPRQLLRRLGVETSNLYAAFVTLAVRLLGSSGEIVAITPRSFCNGPYFRAFRQDFLGALNLQRLHVFGSRQHAFRDDGVLQENIIVYARKGEPQAPTVMLSHSDTPDVAAMQSRTIPFTDIVHPGDPDAFIHFVPDDHGDAIAGAMQALPCTLAQLGLTVSTGRVVDFRARQWLRATPEAGTVPLIYPAHFADGYVVWPKPDTRKPNAIVDAPDSSALLVPTGVYVLVKRFSAKEERRRVVAAVYDPDRGVPGSVVGFENHLNYFHRAGAPLPRTLARGLAAFLNSSRVDTYFRQFNGHTQVNATDLRTLRYPAEATLLALGKAVGEAFPPQEQLDHVVDTALQRP